MEAKDFKAIQDPIRVEDMIRVFGHNLIPIDTVGGYGIRPGFYLENGAMVIPGGVNFTVHSCNATSCKLLLYKRQATEPYTIIDFPESYRIGQVYSMIVFGLDIEEFEYAYSVDGPYDPARGLIYDRTRILLDPYAKAVTGQSRWGSRLSTESCVYRARVVANAFDWGERRQPLIPMEQLIIYELHVRGFTRHESSGVKNPGTFAGLAEKIPYLKKLGINAVELMPIFEFDELRDNRMYNNERLLDYWGYNPITFFAPNTSYTAEVEYNREGEELKQLIRLLHEHGIEVILDVVFNHTAEGDEHGPYFSFKGFDNNVYYMLAPDGSYLNFSGCGNTLNCNHPVVQAMILECLRYWVTQYRVDGFRFDLATILGRNEDGSPSSNPPLLRNLAFDPILAHVKLIAEAWDAGGLYAVGSFPSWSHWSEWNGKYRDDLRRFLKGDSGLATTAAERIAGSRDLYPAVRRGQNTPVNFITCHDGFTLHDLYTYNDKHNEANGWNNTDGERYNNSWNGGVEGETTDPAILALRQRLVRNAGAVLLASQGTPMILAGDEFGNSQFGNNNAYCQDNAISWLDWGLLEQNRDLFNFFSRMIRLRKQHPILCGCTALAHCGLPPISKHGHEPWYLEPDPETRVLGVMFAGRNIDNSEDDVAYVAINAHWESQVIRLPELPAGFAWHAVVNTARAAGQEIQEEGPALSEAELEAGLALEPRSVMILFAAME